MTDQEKTNNALLDQLVYIDNFISEDNNNLNFDLSAFADDSFIFADEEKPRHNDFDGLNINTHGDETHKFDVNTLDVSNLNNLPRFPVPPGAKDTLVEAGLNQNQIDLLSALIAQYQLVQQSENSDPDKSLHESLSLDSAHGEPLHNYSQQPLPLSQVINHEPPSMHSDSFYDMDFSTLLHHTNNHSIANDSNSKMDNQITPQSTENFDKDSIDNDLDKRRRNTAASARFRVKKKLKEKQMEEKITSLTELIAKFESKIESLQLENKLLKKVINDQGSEKSDYELKLLKEKILNEK